MSKPASSFATMSTANGVFAVILAAGFSRRMGQPKQLLAAADGRPLLRWVAETAAASGVDGVLVVTQPEAGAIQAALAGVPVRLIPNPLAEAGLSTSVHAAVRELLRLDATGGIFLLGDQPGVRVDCVNKVLQAFVEQGGSLVQAKYQDGFGHPVLFSRALFPELLECTGDAGGRQVVMRHRDERVAVPVAEWSPPDIDTPEDYQTFLDAWRP